MRRLLALLLMCPMSAWADGIAVVLTNVSVPPQTVAVIDPVTGSSSGGAADIRLGPGDIITFRFRYVPLPDSNGALDSMQSYLTVYVPMNTDVVGARILSDDTGSATAIAPGWPGISVDAGTGASLSQAYADTGIFLAAAGSLSREPAGEFLRLDNGTSVPAPLQATNIASIIGTNAADVRAHDAWDAASVAAYGSGGLAPSNRGSPVAGDGSFYTNDYTGALGPWSRVRYAGSQIGYNPPGTSDTLRRAVVDASTLGADLSPISASQPPFADAKAIRFALGDARIGKPGVVEVALRVVQTPLESGSGTMNDNVICAEIFTGDSAKRSDQIAGPGAADNAWATFLPVPACAHLKLKFDLRADRDLALAGQQVTWTVSGRNLSLDVQTNVRIYFAYDATKGSVQSTQPPATISSCPQAIGAIGLTCMRWTIAELAKSQEFAHAIKWNVGAGGNTRNVMRAVFESDQLPAPGEATLQMLVVTPAPVFTASATLGAASVVPASDMPVNALLSNVGTGSATVGDIGLFAPENWTFNSVKVGDIPCPVGVASEAHCVLSFTLDPSGSKSLTFNVTPPSGTEPGLYPIHLDLWATASGFGGQVENAFPNLVTVPVGLARSAKPVVSCPIATTDTAITGTAADEAATLRIYFDRSLRGSTAGAAWSYSDFESSFGSLYGGIEVRASAQSPGELESELSDACVVGRIPDVIFADGFGG